MLTVGYFVCRVDERRELTIHRDHDVITANILLSPTDSKDNTTKGGPHKPRSFSGGGCFIYSAAELDAVDEENISVRCKLRMGLVLLVLQRTGSDRTKLLLQARRQHIIPVQQGDLLLHSGGLLHGGMLGLKPKSVCQSTVRACVRARARARARVCVCTAE